MAHHGGQQGGLGGAMQGFVTILAVCAAVFAAPHIWPLINADVQRWLVDIYDPGTAAWLHLGGKIATYALTFFGARLALTAGFSLVVIFVAKRLM